MNSLNDRISISVFMPFYNEEKNIESVVERAVVYLENNKNIRDYKVLMINDGSTDGTKVLAENIEKKCLKVRLISHETNQGYGGAIITGIKNSKLDYIFYMDGDGQFDIRELDKFFPYIRNNPAVIGYRKERQDHLIRIINAKAWNVLNKIFFGLDVKDIDCAFKLIERKVLADVPLVSKGAVISTEILVRLKMMGVKFIEIPVNHLPRRQGISTGGNPKVIFKAFQEFARLYSIIYKNEK